MKVYIVVPHLEKSGPINVVFDIVRELICLCEFVIITIHQEQRKSIKDQFTDLGIDIICLNEGKKCSLLRPGRIAEMISDIVGKEKKCIFHAHGHIPALAVSKIKNAIKVVTTHCVTIEDYVYNYGKTFGTLLAWQYNKSLNNFNLCVTISEKTCNYYKQFSNNVNLIYNGIDTSIFKPNAEVKKTIRDELNVSLTATVYIVCGKLINRKNVEYIIQGFAERFQNEQDNILLIVGDGPILAQCKRIAKDISNIIFTGYTPEVIKYLQASDFLVSGSKSEGLPLAVLEGIACGLYPLLSDIESHRDIIERLPILKNSLFSLQETPFLSDIDLYNDLKSISYEDVFPRFIKYFSSSAMAKYYLKAYQKLL